MHLPVAGEPAPPRARKKRRTAEEKARDEALKRALRDQKKLAASFSSQRQMLQHMTVLVDPRLMETDLGLAIGGEQVTCRGGCMHPTEAGTPGFRSHCTFLNPYPKTSPAWHPSSRRTLNIGHFMSSTLPLDPSQAPGNADRSPGQGGGFCGSGRGAGAVQGGALDQADAGRPRTRSELEVGGIGAAIAPMQDHCHGVCQVQLGA